MTPFVINLKTAPIEIFQFIFVIRSAGGIEQPLQLADLKTLFVKEL